MQRGKPRPFEAIAPELYENFREGGVLNFHFFSLCLHLLTFTVFSTIKGPFKCPTEELHEGSRCIWQSISLI